MPPPAGKKAFKLSPTSRNLEESAGEGAEGIFKPGEADQMQTLPDLGPDEEEVEEAEVEADAEAQNGSGTFTSEEIMGEVVKRLGSQKEISNNQFIVERQLVDFVEELLNYADAAGGAQTEALKALKAKSAQVLGATLQARQSRVASATQGGLDGKSKKNVTIAGFGPESGSSIVLYGMQPYLGCDQMAEVNQQACEYKELKLSLTECRGDCRLIPTSRVNELCEGTDCFVFVVGISDMVSGVKDPEGSTLSSNMSEELQRWLSCKTLEGKPVVIVGFKKEDDAFGEEPAPIDDETIGEAVGLHFLWSRRTKILRMSSEDKKTTAEKLKRWIHQTLVSATYASPWQFKKLEGEQALILDSQRRVEFLLRDLRNMTIEESKKKAKLAAAVAEEEATREALKKAQNANKDAQAAEKKAAVEAQAVAEKKAEEDKAKAEEDTKKRAGSKKVYEVVATRPKFGEGRENLPDGSYYEGQFRHFKRDGKGKLVMSADGVEYYEGQFAREAMDGFGIRKWRDGSYYEGQWSAGRKDGEGRFVDATSNRTYDGNWKDGRRHGRGFQIFENGDKYDGRWANGMQHGSGRYFFAADGSVFEGQWSNGAYHGVGIRTLKDGSKERLEYDHGVLASQELIKSTRELALAKQNLANSWVVDKDEYFMEGRNSPTNMK